MKIIVIIAITALCTDLYAVHYKFNYDEAGNRDGRIVFDLNGKEAAPLAKILDHEIRVFPNPAIDKLNIQIGTLREQESATIELFDVHGNSIYKHITSTGELSLGIAAEANGFYVLRITIENEVVEYKIVKQE